MARRLDEIIDLIQNVDKAERHKLREMCYDFERGCPEFLELDPFRLSRATDYTADDWHDFLSHREINNWIDERLNMVIKTSYRKKMRDLSSADELNTSDINSAKLLREVVRENERVDDTVKIIITRIPQKNPKFHQ